MSSRNKNPRKKGTAPRSHSLPPHANNEEWNCKLCEKPDSADNLVQCDLCEHWYHWSCVGVTADIEFQEYICEKCKSTTKTNSSNLAHTQHENQSPNKLQNASNTASVLQSTPENIGTNTSNQESSPTTLQSAPQPNSMPQSTTAIHENQTHSSATSVPFLESILETPISTNKAVAPNTITWKDVAKIRKTYQLCTPERQDNPQGQLNHNKASSCKSSVSASTSKKISLKLKQLEEEHALRERREKDYLDRKYRIYEEMADGVSENSDDQSVMSVEKINRWLECVDLGQQEYPNTSNRHNKTGCNDIKNKDIPTKVNIDNFIDLPNAVNATDQVASRIGHQNLSTIKGNTLLSAEQIAARQVMPKDLPVFTGKPEEWPLFMNALENSSRICGFNDDENLIRLQRCLKGKALEAVRFRLMYPQQVPSVIDTLRMLFGKPDKIISSLLSQVRSEPAPKADKLDTLITFALAVQNICAIMEANHLQNHINNPCLLQELVDKLPPMLKLNWSIHKQGLGDVNLTHFSSWLFNLAQAASDLQDSANTDKKSLANSKQKAFLNIHEQHGSNKANCKICKGSCRTFADCKRFLEMTLNQRWKSVKDFYICRTCLRSHKNQRCSVEKRCGESGCMYKHHRLLHKHDNEKLNLLHENRTTADGNLHNFKNFSTLFRVVPITIFGKNINCDTFALLDDGSSVTLMDADLADYLQLEGDVDPLCLKWTSNMHRSEYTSRRVSARISATGKDRWYDVCNIRTVKSLNLPTQTLDVDHMRQRYSHLKGIPIQSYKDIKPKILIGLEHWNLAVPRRVREGSSSQPIATKTLLGWSVCGPYSAAKNDTLHNFHVCECQQDVDSKLHELVEEYFSVEAINAKSKSALLSREDEEGLKMLESFTIYENNRYTVPLLWKYDQISMPNNRSTAERRLQLLEKKLSKEPLLRENLNQQIREYERKDYARKLSKAEASEVNERTWYLPIFPVFNTNKPHKIRMVWDAAAKTDGISLNTMLLRGPDTLPSLISVLYVFRERRVALCGDIKEMFHQVRIRTSDQCSQRFLWRNSPMEQMEVFVMQVLIFGAACSPSCAQYAKNRNALRFINEYPKAANAIIHNHYVDDFLFSFDTDEEAVELADEVKYIHAQGGFQIGKFLSNSDNVMKALQVEPDVCNKELKNCGNLMFVEKILGLLWSPAYDSFSFSFEGRNFTATMLSGHVYPTKRELLKMLMSIFDPLGLISNFTILLKILLQEVWRSAIAWDQKINDEHHAQWKKWLSFLPAVRNISVPRCYLKKCCFNEDADVQLHTFVDAGKDAYAAVMYLRVCNNDCTEVTLVGAKAKVAPLKGISIPRLELEAALLGVRLAKAAVDGHSIKISSKTFWTDSKTVLSWISGDYRKYKQFVVARVCEILEETNKKDWRWVPSKQNVADDATKWKANINFQSSSRWFCGPTFLTFPQCDWPLLNEAVLSTQEEAKVNLLHYVVTSECIIKYVRFSRWNKLVRTIAYVLRFIDRARKLQNNSSVILNRLELSKAQNYLYRQCQQEAFPTESALLRATKLNQCETSLDKNSILFKLTPYIDEDDVIRIRGRIDAADGVSVDTKRPIVLPKNHAVTALIINEYHLQYHHQYNETVVNELRQKYYIPSLRVLLKKVKGKCQLCKNLKAKPICPIMSELPAVRLKSFTRPFSYIGMDYFGPMNVAIGRRIEKRWGVIITCMSIRAIHVEIAHSLSSDSCILALKRFIARRGTPIEITTDNGTNFKGASEELRKAIGNISNEELAKEFMDLKIKWSFIPPLSPHMGGVWERMVRSVKQTLAAIKVTKTPSDELLLTMMAEVEYVINSRPLTYIPLDSDSEEALTPNHFLLGSSNGKKPFGQFSDCATTLKKNWMIAEQFSNQFWKKWIQDYLPSLTRRTKWFAPTKSLEEGDVVIVVDENRPRNVWPKARIIKLIRGRDGRSRSAVIKTSSGVYTRPVSKLALLDVRRFGGDGNPN